MTDTPDPVEQVCSMYPTEADAFKALQVIRWKDGEFCLICGYAGKMYHFKDGKYHKCSRCRKRFTMTRGTIFEGTKLSLRTWLAAIWCFCYKGPIRSTRLAEELGITQKSAWYMLSTLRKASKTPSFKGEERPSDMLEDFMKAVAFTWELRGAA